MAGQAQTLSMPRATEKLALQAPAVNWLEVSYKHADTLAEKYGAASSASEVLVDTSKADRIIFESNQAAYSQGRQDARRYFRAPGAFWGTYSATIGGAGVGGVITGVAIGAHQPKVRHFVVPAASLLQDANYLAGYRRQAQAKKRLNTFSGFAAGVITGGLLILPILAGILYQ